MRQCIEDRQDASGQVAYANEMGDIRQLPQISTMKTASAEIRAFNKQLGICDGHEEVQRDARPRESPCSTAHAATARIGAQHPV